MRAYNVDEIDYSLSSPTSSPFQLVVDIYPPNAVTDLKAELLESDVQISFTAPGDDISAGKGLLIMVHNKE